jgi:hypothetical protein
MLRNDMMNKVLLCEPTDSEGNKICIGDSVTTGGALYIVHDVRDSPKNTDNEGDTKGSEIFIRPVNETIDKNKSRWVQDYEITIEGIE